MPKSIQKRIDEQIKKWEMEKKEAKPIQEFINVITISRECGSQGCEVAERLCSETGLDLFDKKILEAMVDISKTNRGLLETLDERSMNIVDDIISNFVNEHHLWADEYSKLLLKILTTIGKHGNAVILGRGANCVLKGKNVLRVKIVAPMNLRRNQTQKCHGMNLDDAMKHMVSTDSNRTAFVKRYFNCDANDPSNYDLILNTGTLSVEKAVQIIKCAIN
ncbi:cytidylate kinase-like family protein [Desulfobacula phenolica]|uniref:Cytidylate kinase n=1 Tax=Desulfobacula phenolica TaxID=90732 RepID=A0A1H2K0C0_9BACT|nr:cytidylate kinase-like family protein [Desulfobacula phenolica]SDU61921.1 Cytidylate kinase [Desulfobacula phenolica]